MQHAHILDLTVRRLPRGIHARIVEEHFDDAGALQVRGLTDITEGPVGRRALAAPEYSMEPPIERIYLGAHPAEMEVMADDELGTISNSIKGGAAWLLTVFEGVRMLVPVPRYEIRQFEDQKRAR